MQYIQLEGGTMTGKVMSMQGECNMCGKEHLSEFVDGKTRLGPWANMCMPCYRKVGVGIGYGRGQRYALVQVSGSAPSVQVQAAQSHTRAKADLFDDLWDKGEPTE